MMLFHRKKLLARLIAITLATMLLPLLIGGFYFLRQNRSHLLALTEQRLALEARLQRDMLEEKLIFPLREISAQLESLRTPVTLGRVRRYFSRYPEIDTCLVFFSEVQSLHPYLENAWYPSPAQHFLPDSLKAGMVAELRRRSASRTWSTYRADSSSVYLLGVLRLQSGKPLLFGLDLRRFLTRNASLFSAAASSSPEHLSVFDLDKGFLLFSSSPAFQRFSAAERLALLQQQQTGPYRAVRLRPNRMGEVLAAFSDFQGELHWRIFVDTPAAAALAPMEAMKLNFAAILFFGIFLAVLGTTYYWKRIAGPLDRFARSATEIARGDFNQRIKIDSDDEIGRLAKIFNYMVIELRRLNRMNLNKIISEKNKTQTIIQNIADGVVVTDSENRIITVNTAVERWFRVREEEVRDKPVDRVLAIPELTQLLQEIQETELEGTFTRELTVTLPHENKPRVLQARATKIKGRDNGEVDKVLVLRDITREKEIDRMKTELVSMVAHELKSPLATISGFAELLQMPEESPEAVQEYASVIRNEANRLADLVNKFLDITKIEAGRMDFHPTDIPASQILNGVLHIAAAEAQKKGIQLDVEVPDENVTLHADEKMMSEVLLNLLANAVKYSPPNTRVTLRIFENENAVVLQVQDEGYGIAPEHLPHIFKKFYRIKNDPHVQEERGTGLGLSLVKEIVELHKGRIKVDSQVGKGTTFTITFPKARRPVSWRP